MTDKKPHSKVSSSNLRGMSTPYSDQKPVPPPVPTHNTSPPKDHTVTHQNNDESKIDKRKGVVADGVFAKGVFETGVYDDGENDDGVEKGYVQKGYVENDYVVDGDLSTSDEIAGFLTHQMHRDTASKNDLLGFNPIVQALARMIVHKRTLKPITVGIHGEWGSGKSSILLQLRSELDRLISTSNEQSDISIWKREFGLSDVLEFFGWSGKKRVIHIEFDAWMHDVNSNMLGVFLQEITNQIESGRGVVSVFYSRFICAIKKIPKTSVAYFFILVSLFFILYFYLSPTDNGFNEKWLSGIPLVALFFGRSMREAVKKVMSPLGINVNSIIKGKDYKSEVDGIHSFKDSLSDILSTALEEDGVMIIYVDDLDRCEPKSVVTIIETINKFLDLDKCCFILGVAKERTAELINKHYGYEEVVGNNGDRINYGREFLHKMIQLPINLPQMPTEVIFSYVHQLHGMTEKSDGYDVPQGDNLLLIQNNTIDLEVPSRIVEELAYICQYLRPLTPRNVKRFQNKFLFYYLLVHVWTEYSEHIDADLLPAWILLRERYPVEVKDITNYENLTWQILSSDANPLKNKFTGMRNLLREIIDNHPAGMDDVSNVAFGRYKNSETFIKRYIDVTGWD